MKFIVGIPSFNRPRVFRLSVSRLIRLERLDGMVIVADATEPAYVREYEEVVRDVADALDHVIYDVRLGRRGSVNARNMVFELADQCFTDDCVLITYDDDYICPLEDWLSPVSRWLADAAVGVVGGRVVNLRRRRVDPDFSLNLFPYVADVLTRVTGFIFLDTEHGPRYVDYTTPLMAIKMSLIKNGLRYDPEYGGTGYREESDLQEQVRGLGYKIVFEPRFYAYHLNLEEGGNRAIWDVVARFFWKARNHAYYMLKHRKPFHKLVSSSSIVMAYALLHGGKAFASAMRGLREAFTVRYSQN